MITFCPTGKRLATWNGTEIVIRSVPGLSEIMKLPGEHFDVRRLFFTNDGLMVGAVAGQAVDVWDLRTSKLHFALTISGGRRFAISSYGWHFALQDAHGIVEFWKFHGRRLSRSAIVNLQCSETESVSPNGRWKAVATRESTTKTLPSVDSVAVFDRKTYKRTATFGGLIKGPAPGLEGKTSSGVKHMRFSHNGRMLAVANVDVVRLYDLLSGMEERTLSGNVGGILHCAFGPDDRLLATAGSDGTVRIWDLETRRLQRTLPWHEKTVKAVEFSADGRWLASVDSANTVKLWDMSPDWNVRIFDDHSDGAYGISFSGDGRYLASGGGAYPTFSPGTLAFRAEVTDREVETGRVVFRCDVPRPRQGRFGILAVALSRDGTLVAAGGCTGWIKIWDVETGHELHQLDVSPIGNEVHSLVFSNDGRQLIGSGRTGTAVWSVEDKRTLREWRGEKYSVLGPSGKSIVTLGRGIRAYDLESGEIRYTHSIPSPPGWRLAVSRDGSFIAVSLDTRGAPLERKNEFIRLIDAASGKTVRILKSKIHRDYEDKDYVTSVYGIAFSPDGNWLACGGGNKTVRIWDVESGEELLVFPHAHQVFAVEFSPDGRWLASAGGHWVGPRRGEVRIWDAMPIREQPPIAALSRDD